MLQMPGAEEADNELHAQLTAILESHRNFELSPPCTRVARVHNGNN